MALRMARRSIRATHDATAYDPVPAPLDLPRASGERPASAAADASADADAVFVTVATPEQSMAALFGSDGAAGALAPGAPVLVMRTIGPAAVRELTDRRAPARVGLLDAPMSGGVARAESGDPVVMVGGPREQFEICLASLDRVVCRNRIRPLQPPRSQLLLPRCPYPRGRPIIAARRRPLRYGADS